MVMLNKEELKKLVKEYKMKSMEDVNEFLKNISSQVLEIMLDGELEDHLGYGKYDYTSKNTDNSRNGNYSKEVNSKFGEMELKIPRDRKSEFEPVIVKKGQKEIAGMEEKIISMYAKGMTVRDIQGHIEELYNYEMSAETISNITDRVTEKAKEWQARPLK